MASMDYLDLKGAERPLLGAQQDEWDCTGVRSRGRWRLALAALATFVPLLILVQVMEGLSATSPPDTPPRPRLFARRHPLPVHRAPKGGPAHVHARKGRAETTLKRFTGVLQLRHLTQCMRHEFKKYHAKAIRISISPLLAKLPHGATVQVAAADVRSTELQRWLNYRRAEKVPFVLFSVARTGPKAMSAERARVTALLATRACLLNARYMVYADVDTLVNFDELHRVAPAWTADARPFAAVRSSGKHPRLLAGFVVINARHPDVQSMLRSWLNYSANNRHLRGSVLQALCKRNKVFCTHVRALSPSDAAGPVLNRCQGNVSHRDACMRELRVSIWRERRRTSGFYFEFNGSAL